MAAPTPLRYHGLVSGQADGGQPRIQVLAGERVRDVPLTRRDLVRLIQRAAAALESMDDEDRRAGQAGGR